MARERWAHDLNRGFYGSKAQGPEHGYHLISSAERLLCTHLPSLPVSLMLLPSSGQPWEESHFTSFLQCIFKMFIYLF